VSKENNIDPYDSFLMVPGPTIVDSRVRNAMSNNQMGHLSEEFTEDFVELLELSKKLFATKNASPFVITGSGTIAMEATVLSLLEQNNTGLILDTGYFAQRFGQMLDCYSIKSNVIPFDFGSQADPDVLKSELNKNNYDAVFITHVDTSSTVMNNISDLVQVVKDSGSLAIVDSVCGVGGCELYFDKLGADVVLTTSQKAIGSVPGAGLMMLSQNAIEILENRKSIIPSYYLNLKKWKVHMDNPKTYVATPAIQVMVALKTALEMIMEEGLENRWNRHKKVANAVHAGIESLGLDFVAEENYRAYTVTGFHVPKGKAISIQSELKSRYNVEVASGFGDMKNNAIRVGHMANIGHNEVGRFLNGLESILSEYDNTIKKGTVINAISQILK
tara:strand:+ start:384 stop:1550 length:1167 start_codon:yes stop_codon:yes gene_type:complete